MHLHFLSVQPLLFFFQTLTGALWAITAHHETINDRAAHVPEVKRIPVAFSKFAGRNDYKKKRKSKPSLSATVLQGHSDGLLRMLVKPIFSTVKWKDWSDDISRLAASIGSYAEYLRTETQKQTKRQSMNHPPREVFDLLLFFM